MLNSLQVGGHTYTIKLINGTYVSSSADNVGDHNQAMGEIRIATRALTDGYKTLDYLNESLLHEIIHAIDYAYLVKIDEDQVERLAQGLLQVLKQYGVTMINNDDLNI